jgi:predicted short-subunit dehydrogenase-like oxidoreductase (DUF2520 family)
VEGYPESHDHQHDDLPHAHPHRRSGAGEPPLVGIIGAGAVGTALGAALHRAEWPVVAVASRDAARRERFRSLVPGARGFAEAPALLDEAELVFLAVPDDAIEQLAGQLRLYGGQALVHTSGVLGVEVLEPARAAGTQLGTFHPLIAFADTERAIAAFHGATVAVEGDDQLVAHLADMAEALGATAVRLAPGSKAAYHAAAVLSAGGFVALLDAIAELGKAAGLDEQGALAVYGGLIEQTLGNARALGIRAALTGPMTRGDVGTLERHLDAMRRLAPRALPLYVAAAEREIALAESRGSLAPEAAESMRGILATAG